MTAVKSVKQCMVELRSSVEDMVASATERIGSPSLGDVVRQGDIYLVCIDRLPDSEKTKERQLAQGNTQGSRHILEGDATIVNGHAYLDRPQVLTGPAFHCNSEVEVRHVEHGNKILPEGTTWQVCYQLSHSEHVRRVQD